MAAEHTRAGIAPERIRALLVDDDLTWLRELAGKLRSEGIRDIEAVTSGEAALARIEDRSISLVLLDLEMPGGICGVETLCRIRQARPMVTVGVVSQYPGLFGLAHRALTSFAVAKTDPISNLMEKVSIHVREVDDSGVALAEDAERDLARIIDLVRTYPPIVAADKIKEEYTGLLAAGRRFWKRTCSRTFTYRGELMSMHYADHQRSYIGEWRGRSLRATSHQELKARFIALINEIL